jgi:hypothetical protein
MVSLLLPSIQAARETARRATCMNQVRQLLLAVHDFESAHEHFPSGTNNPQGPIQNLPSGQHISWIARILPYLDEGARYSRIDLTKGAYDFRNDPIRQTTIEVLLCPSGDGTPTTSNYAACHHELEAPIDVDNHGVFFLNSRISRDELRDGAAYTIFLGEKLPDASDLGWLSGTPATLRNTGSPLNANRNSPAVVGPPWVIGKVLDPEALEDSTAESRAQSADDEGRLPHSRLGGDPTAPLAVGGFASRHLDGVHFAMGDGAARFILNQVTPAILRQLAHREDGAVVDVNDFD